MGSNSVNKYFSENADAWLTDAYTQGAYNYPVGFHRTRIVTEILENIPGNPGLRLIDLGCGGGDLCISAGQLGYKVTGIDQSSDMIKISNAKLQSHHPDIACRITFTQYSLDEVNKHLAERAQDVVTAMGFIGYLPSDDLLFSSAHRLLRSGGRLIISCRNRLFNMFSGSMYAVREIANGTALSLIEELEELYHQIPQQVVIQFLQLLQETASRLHSDEFEIKQETTIESTSRSSAPKFTATIEARQHTPKQLKAEAERHGFTTTALYGVHPHLLVPRLNTLLPPQIFNRLSDCLCTFEKQPISLTWSSVFIAAFQKA